MPTWSNFQRLALAAVFVLLGACNPIEGKQSVLPSSFIDTVAWSFAEPVPTSSDELVKAVAEYHAKIRRPFNSGELTATSPFRRVDTTYTYATQRPSGDWEHIEVTVRIDGEGKYLSYADILWKLHHVAHEHLKNQDHHYFEGFHILPTRENSDTPRYEVYLGS